ncbi:gephyrin-like molybdotransferase receptor GlpR [Streptomyces sp. NPDC048172]|uniref:divisome protein SepX/GlpR n=1 Tax=Streptomyces sp. NPDC048172 TaxID=3365505 RepID=UPI00371AE08B
MSSSGLIYAVIVGAWAAYLVPMWLRRQDELNEARPTERFSTAIRLLSGKAAMERRYAKDAERREAREAQETGAALATAEPEGDHGDFDDGYADDAYGTDPDDGTAEDAVDVRAFADPKTMVSGHSPEAVTAIQDNRPAPSPSPSPPPLSSPSPERSPELSPERSAAGSKASRDAKRAKRAKLLARRRRTTMLLFLGFTLGAVVAAVLGLAFLWVPAVPGVLLSAYIVHLRAQERRRFAFTMDRRRAEDAARSLRERRPRASAAPSGTGTRHRPPAQYRSQAQGRPHAESERQGAAGQDERRAPAPERGGGRGRPSRPVSPAGDADPEAAADRRALVEQTDHAEWVDQQRARDREHPEGEGWEPVPVPLPTYVSAPVAPRTAREVDLEAPDAWSSARSSAAEPPPREADHAPPETSSRPRRTRDRNRTPLFDQYEDEDRPRAANE